MLVLSMFSRSPKSMTAVIYCWELLGEMVKLILLYFISCSCVAVVK